MSYEDTRCPCGGKKQRETMLCADCLEYLKDHNSMKAFNDHTLSVGSRRHAAFVLVTLARKRPAEIDKQRRLKL